MIWCKNVLKVWYVELVAKKEITTNGIKMNRHFSKVLFKHYMERRMLVLSKNELKVLYNYLVMVMEPENSKKALHVLYLPPWAAAFRLSEDILSARGGIWG